MLQASHVGRVVEAIDLVLRDRRHVVGFEPPDGRSVASAHVVETRRDVGGLPVPPETVEVGVVEEEERLCETNSILVYKYFLFGFEGVGRRSAEVLIRA